MKKFIHKYLNENYYVEYDYSQRGVSSWGIFPIYTKGVNVRKIEYGDKLVKDIVTIFDITEEACKNEINIWADKDLSWYWEQKKSFDELAFPLARRVAAQLVGQDLVPVKPMSLPKMNLMYLDFIYKKEPWYKKVWNKVKSFFKKKPKKSLGDFKNKQLWLEEYSRFHRLNK